MTGIDYLAWGVVLSSIAGLAALVAAFNYGWL